MADVGVRLVGARVHVSADFGPYGRRRDETVAATVPLVAVGSPYAVDPGEVRSQAYVEAECRRLCEQARDAAGQPSSPLGGDTEAR